MRINQNISALNAYRNMVMTDNRLNKSLERLSSGLRINRAADDAAGLAISEKMRGQIRGLNQAMRNAQDGISLIQTAEGALNETHSILQRMRELSVQAASDTLTSSDRVEIQKEINQLTAEVNRIANTTEFNTKKLLDGTTSALTSTSDLSTKVFMRDGLRVIDQFGQKAVGGGNYKLSIDATPGTAQILKTDIMKVKHGEDVNILGEQHLGHATAEITIAASDDDADSTITFDFIIDGETYTVTGTIGNDVDNDLAAAIVTNIEANDELSELITVTRSDNVLTITRTDPGDFSIDVTTLTNATMDDGAAMTAGNTYDYVASEQNVTLLNSIDPAKFVAGDYTVQTDADFAESQAVTGYFWGAKGEDLTAVGSLTTDTTTVNQSLSLVVTGIDNNTITFAYDFHELAYADASVTTGKGTIELTANDNNAGTVIGGVNFTNLNLAVADNFSIGDKIVLNTAADASVDHRVQIDRGDDTVLDFRFDDIDDATITFNFFQLDSETGQLYDSGARLEFGELLTSSAVFPAAGFSIDTQESIGQVASLNTAIYDIDRFWDASGNFLVDDPQTITLVQGDGTKAAFTIFRNDTISDVVNKINDAIANPKTNNPGTIEVGKGLGQGDYAPDGAQFAYYVETPTEGGTYDTVQGTIVINSAIAGKAGEINFVGNDQVLQALSLTTIRESSENQFNVTVTNAHSDAVVARNVTVTGNMLVGTVHANVDVQFDAMANINVKWQGEEAHGEKSLYSNQPNAFYFEKDSGSYETFVHLADNTMVFHIGANPLQDIGAAIGDMRAEALGIDNIIVTDRASANRAIAQIDNAIGRVSAERSKMGALQNRLEHTINNLGVSAENLTAAESRIRDLDFAMEMIEFTRNQIMMQAGTAMLAQANMKPQSVLMLLG